MKFLIQKVKNLNIEDIEVDDGFLIYVGIEKKDENRDLKEIINYLENLSIVDKEGKFSQKIKDLKPKLIFVSNITLLAQFDKHRINFNNALEPNKAKEIFNNFVRVWENLNYEVFKTEFGSFLEISTINIGPINFFIEL